MAKTTNPLNSQEASGSIESTLTFSSNKGRSYVKIHASPKQPNTKSQRMARMALSFASKIAAAWPSQVENAFGEEAQRKGTTAANEYIARCAEGLKTWRGITPVGTKITSNPGVGGVNMTATAGSRSIKWTWNITNPAPNYGWALVVSTVQPQNVLFENVIFVTTHETTFRQTGLTPGVPYYGRVYIMREANAFRRITSSVAATPTA